MDKKLSENAGTAVPTCDAHLSDTTTWPVHALHCIAIAPKPRAKVYDLLYSLDKSDGVPIDLAKRALTKLVSQDGETLVAGLSMKLVPSAFHQGCKSRWH
jgi:hypothetical protein